MKPSLLLALLLFCAPQAAAQSARGRNSTDQIIVKLKDKKTASATYLSAGVMTNLSSKAGLALTHHRPMSGDAQVFKLPGWMSIEQVQAAAQRLSADPGVEYAVPDGRKWPALAPTDPQYGSQWNLKASASEAGGANLPDAWSVTTGATSLVVAVVDTGLLLTHADIAGRTVAGYDFIYEAATANDGNGRDGDPSDPGDWVAADECGAGEPAANSSWHGTHVAGILGAAANNGAGIAGVVWGSKLQAVRVLGKCGGYDSDIADGIRWAAGLSVSGVPANATPAKVINVSISGEAACDAATQSAINAAVAAGALVVVAAGNANVDVSGYAPANCSNALAVAATGRTGGRASYSNYGAIIDIAAPGGSGANGILSTKNTGTQGPVADAYVYAQGTSMAAPHVSGIAALMLSLKPSLTPAQLLQMLKDSARAFPTGTGSDCTTSICGAGIVDALAAVRKAVEITAAPTNITVRTLGTSSIAWSWSLVENAVSYNVYNSTTLAYEGNVTTLGLNYTVLDPNTVYGVVLRGLNAAGVEGPSAVAPSTSTLALAPANAALSVGITSVTVAFPAFPANPRSASSFGYRLEASTDASYRGTLFSSATPSVALSTLCVAGLSAYTTYYLRLASLNSLGGPNWTALGSTLTLTDLGPPGALPLSDVAAGSLRASWTLNGNPEGLQYVAEASTAADYTGSVRTSSLYGFTTVIEGLSSDSTYYLRVRAPPGPYVPLGSTVTLAYVPAAGSPTFAGLWPSSAALAWSPADNPLGTRYRAELSSSSGFTAGVLSSTTFNPSAVFTSLAPNTTYHLRVSALNRMGSPSAYLEASTSTLALPPGLDASPFVAVTGSVTVRWVPLPVSPSSASCEGYRVEASSAADFSGTVFSNSVAGAAASELGVGGLTFGATYHLRVGALNWNDVGSFISLGSTRAYSVSISSESVPASAPLSLVLTPPVQQITRVVVDIPAGALPAGSNVTVNASLSQIPAPDSNQARLTALGSGVAIDIAATGGQPLSPVTITMTYDPAALPAGADPRRIAIARYVPAEGRWTLLPSQVDTSARTVRGVTTHFSLFAPFLMAPGQDAGEVQIFPSPWEPGSGDPDFDAPSLTFSGLPADGKVRLYSILGESVWEGESASGVLLWDGKSRTGSRAGSGTYLAVITGAGSKAVRRVVIIR
ncbi:MAG TPA: hypothetical protein DCM05_05255 [Elusimicrobia bacterium]|nr:hypothetical protein [Elusimicrobiota bacterium]